MAYSTGVSSSPTDLLQKLVAWLVTNGWAQDASAAEGNGWRAHLHKDGLFVSFRAAMNESLWPAYPSGNYDRVPGYGIGLYLGDGYNGAAAWHLQSGRPILADTGTGGCGMALPAGAVAGYHFFDDFGHITVVVERAPGVFCFIGFGPAISKLGHAEDYPYFFGSSSAHRNTDPGEPYLDLGGINITARPPTSHGDYDRDGYCIRATAFVRVDGSIWSGRWISNCSTEGAAYGWTGRLMRSVFTGPGDAYAPDRLQYVNYNHIAQRAHQTAFGGATLLPLHLFYKHPTTLRFHPIGFPGYVRWCTGVGRGFSPKAIYQVGGIDWMLFPGFAVMKT
jgi:hypothetical protein